MVGETRIAEVVSPVFHKYILPPVAVSVEFSPEHIVVLPVITGAGRACTVMVKKAVSLQLFVSAPETVYVIVPATAGEIVIAEEVAPVFHQ